MAEGKNCQSKTFNWRLPEQPTNALTIRARTEKKAFVQIALLYTTHESENHCFISAVGTQKKKCMPCNFWDYINIFDNMLTVNRHLVCYINIAF